MAKKDNQLAFNQSVDYANIKALERVRQLSLCRREAAIGSWSDAIEPTKRHAHLCSVLQPHAEGDFFQRQGSGGQQPHCMGHWKEAVYQAAMLDPNLQSELSIGDIVSLCDDLITAHGDGLPKFE